MILIILILTILLYSCGNPFFLKTSEKIIEDVAEDLIDYAIEDKESLEK